jgi:hypothetical protein
MGDEALVRRMAGGGRADVVMAVSVASQLLAVDSESSAPAGSSYKERKCHFYLDLHFREIRSWLPFRER